MSEEERQWVIDNVEEICAKTNDIDEICCALEHSTIFVIEHLQTIVTDFLKLQQENKKLKEDKFKLQARADRYKCKLDLYKDVIDELDENCKLSELWCKSQQENKQLQNKWNELKEFINSGYYDSYIYSSTILNKMQELEGSND